MEWLYERNADNSARFILGTIGTNPLICFGINPSTAEPDSLDPTLKRVSKYAEKNGFDSWIMLNIYPQRATRPSEVSLEMDETLHQKNLMYVARTLAMHQSAIWAAWGGNITVRGYFLKCLHDIDAIVAQHGCQWVTLGKTVDRHPYHPLYRGKGFKLYSSPLSAYDISRYTA